MLQSISQNSRQRVLHGLVLSVFVAVLAWVILAYTSTKQDHRVPVKSLASAQQADAPLGFPHFETNTIPAFDPRFIQLTAFERALIPTATRMAAAMGTSHGALTYNAQHYWDNNIERGGHHTGDDINGIGGMNTDLGDPVYSVANGLVIYRGEPSTSWGKTLILAHRNPEGDILLSMYSHLEKSFAPYGHLIPLGEVIGTVGTANKNYPAHLHLEMRDSTGVHIGRGYTHNRGESLSPSEILHDHTGLPPDNLFLAPLALAINIEQEQRKERFFSSE